MLVILHEYDRYNLDGLPVSIDATRIVAVHVHSPSPGERDHSSSDVVLDSGRRIHVREKQDAAHRQINLVKAEARAAADVALVQQVVRDEMLRAAQRATG